MILDFFSGTDPKVREALAIRDRVFVREQGIDPDLEMDDLDGICWHAVAYQDTQPVGTARLIMKDRFVAKIGRVAVLPAARGRGVATSLMRMLEDYAHREGITRIEVDAQIAVQALYEKLDYTPEGDHFLDAGIIHIRMAKPL